MRAITTQTKHHGERDERDDTRCCQQSHLNGVGLAVVLSAIRRGVLRIITALVINLITVVFNLITVVFASSVVKVTAGVELEFARQPHREPDQARDGSQRAEDDVPDDDEVVRRVRHDLVLACRVAHKRVSDLAVQGVHGIDLTAQLAPVVIVKVINVLDLAAVHRSDERQNEQRDACSEVRDVAEPQQPVQIFRDCSARDSGDHEVGAAKEDGECRRERCG